MNQLLSFFILATGSAEHAAEALPPVGSFEYILQSNVINIVLVGILLFFILKNIQVGQKLKEFQAKTIERIEQAEIQQQQAEKDLKATEERAHNVEAEVKNILEAAEKNAQTMAQSIITQAQEEAARIKDNAQKRIALEEKQRAAELKQRLMGEAIVAAKELLENTLSNDDKVQSVEQFINDLPQIAKGVK